MLFYGSFGVVLAADGGDRAGRRWRWAFAGAMAARSRLRAAAAGWAWIYTSAWCAAFPDIIFFLFVPFALDEGFEYHPPSRIKCPDWDAIRLFSGS